MKRQTKQAYLPPHDIDAEEVVIGALLIESNTIMVVLDSLKQEYFYKEENRILCASILDIHSKSKKIDLLTIMADLRQKGLLDNVGGMLYITSLTDRVVSTANIHAHIDILRQHYIAREQIQLYTVKIKECYDLENPDMILSNVSNELSALQQGTSKKKERTMFDLAKEAISIRESRGNERVKFNGVSSGINALDSVSMGWKGGDLIYIAGRPAMGKTAVILSLTANIARRGEPVAVVSCEMTDTQLYGRIQSSESQIRSKKIVLNDLSPNERERLYRSDQILAELPIIIDDTAGINIDVLVARATLWKAKYKIKILFIDYLQLITSSAKNFGNDNMRITEISAKLKKLAKDLDIPVVCLSQLSRAVEQRGGNKMPQLSDLRDSGSIEQDADGVIFLWRPAYYKIQDPIEFYEYDVDILPDNLLGLIYAKNRGGETKNIPVHIDLSTMTLKDHPAIEHLFEKTLF